MYSLIQKQGPSEAPSLERQEGGSELGTMWAKDDLPPTEGQGQATLGEGPGLVGGVRQWSLLPCGISRKISAAHVRWLKGAVFCVNADISSNGHPVGPADFWVTSVTGGNEGVPH